MKYNQEQVYLRNHVVVQGRVKALEEFVSSSTVINGRLIRHKLRNSFSQNSEDALTWSCFDALRNYKSENIVSALNEIFEDAFENTKPFDFSNKKNIYCNLSIYCSLTRQKS